MIKLQTCIFLMRHKYSKTRSHTDEIRRKLVKAMPAAPDILLSDGKGRRKAFEKRHTAISVRLAFIPEDVISVVACFCLQADRHEAKDIVFLSKRSCWDELFPVFSSKRTCLEEKTMFPATFFPKTCRRLMFLHISRIKSEQKQCFLHSFPRRMTGNSCPTMDTTAYRKHLINMEFQFGMFFQIRNQITSYR